jgi:glutamate-1-semialdehyde 2,1-aminomutase
VQRAITATSASGVHLNGIAQMWVLRFDDPLREAQVLRSARAEGVLLKRGAYDFAALAHDAEAIAAIERALTNALRETGAAGA